jgi:hypothetical protein
VDKRHYGEQERRVSSYLIGLERIRAMRNRFCHWCKLVRACFVGRPGHRRSSAARPGVRRYRLAVEQLEDRCVPSVFKVTGLGDGLFPVKKIGPDTFSAPTLRSAIEAANQTPGSNTIELTVAGTYRITIPPGANDETAAGENNATGDFDIIPNASSAAGSTLTIVNTSGGAAAVSGNGLDRVFDINPLDATPPTGFTVVMKGFTVEDGFASNAASPDGGTASGGGIRDQGNVNLTLDNMVLTNDSATADGGGVVMFNTTVNNTWVLTVNDSVISNDHAGDAGGGIDTDGIGTVFINNSLITGSTDVHQGAGVYIDVAAGSSVIEGANMTMTNTVVSNNSALADDITSSGGGISNAGNGTMIIDSSTVSGNFSGGQGGGFSDENGAGKLVVSNSIFVGNSASMDGGAIQEGGPLLKITNTLIEGNSSGATGGGILAGGSVPMSSSGATVLILERSTVANNTSAGNGGGLELDNTASASAGSTITDSTFTHNQALNNAGANGGGISAESLGSLALLNDTIDRNAATMGGGLFWDGTGSVSVQNTILAANSAVTAPDVANTGTLLDNGGNLVGNPTGSVGFTSSTDQLGTAAKPLAPVLGALHNNGGPTIGAPGTQIVLPTQAPLVGSPAIGKGIIKGAPKVDERGFPSVVKGKVNVGAVSQARATGGCEGSDDREWGPLSPESVDDLFAAGLAATGKHVGQFLWW